MKYDYLIVGAGLFGSVFAFEMNKKGKKCLILEKRSHIGGNIYTQEIDGINVHIYGAHIFHTKNKDIWEYINKFSDFYNYKNQVIANYKGEIFSLPFNMYTFNKMWGVVTPKDAKKKVEEQVKELNITNPKNLEEQAISLVGIDIYKKLIEGYTEKQWGKKCKDLPSFIIKRIPVRYTYDNNYFNDQYQGIPKNGYTSIIEKMLEGMEVKLNTNFFDKRDFWEKISDKIIFTGMIDEYYNYCFGELEYRSLKFEIESLNTENYQGNAVVNYTDKRVPYTRIIEHKYFEFVNCKKTVISREYPIKYKRGEEPYYPINDE
ncbi:UDP-galactopyranose mutase, partial [Fusobacterium nucleatum]|uniref:UDP-galactopyranose mutase n=2 Tax=Fusobacterium TaxID=848 RepID=UPI001F528032